jgi:hypothetical protein
MGTVDDDDCLTLAGNAAGAELVEAGSLAGNARVGEEGLGGEGTFA